MELGLLAGLIVPALLGLVWLIRLEGRVNVQQAQIMALEKRLDGLETQILDRLKSIDDKLDRKADK